MSNVRVLAPGRRKTIAAPKAGDPKTAEDLLTPELRELRLKLERNLEERLELLDRFDDPDTRAAIISGGH